MARRWTWGRKRVLAAALVLLALIVITSVGSFTEFLRVCDADGACRPLTMTDPPVVLGLLLAVGFLLPDVQTFRIGTEGVEFERDTVAEDEDLSDRIGLLERKIGLYREQIGEEGAALGERDALSTHAQLLAEKRIGFLLLTVGLLLYLTGLVLKSPEGGLTMGAVAATVIVVGLALSVVVTRVVGRRIRDQARRAQRDQDPDELPEQ